MSAPKRIQLQRTKGWRKPEGAVVVARPSRWGNPFDVRRYGLDMAVALYEDMARGIWSPGLVAGWSDSKVNITYATRTAWLERIGGHPSEMAVSYLAGHDLACWCPLDQPCHADVLLELANGTANVVELAQ